MDIAPVEKSVTNRTAFGDISFILSTNLGISRFGLTGGARAEQGVPSHEERTPDQHLGL